MKLVQKLFSKNTFFALVYAVSISLSFTVLHGSQAQVEEFKNTMFEAARAKSPTFEKFVKRYSLSDEEIAAILNCQNSNPSPFKHIYIFPIPQSNLYCKGVDLNRLVNAIRMRECIQRNKLNLIGVPEKKIAFINGQWIVFAQAVQPHPDRYTKKISLALLKQLIVIAEETGYSDWHSTLNTNWIWTTDGKLTCVDTENISFSYNNFTARSFCKNSLKNHINFVRTLESWKHHIEEDAYNYLANYIKELEKRQSALQKFLQNTLTSFKKRPQTVDYVVEFVCNECEYLPHNSSYDPNDMDLSHLA